VAAKELGYESVKKYRNRLHAARVKGFVAGKIQKKDEPAPIFPTFSDDDIPVEELIDNLEKRVVKKMAREREERWYPIMMPDDLPFANVIFGDPHMGTHCNWPQLRADVNTVAITPGMYGTNIGDLTDNWPLSGRLSRLWATNDMSTSTEWKLIKWFTQDAGIVWIAYVLGNHDHFSPGAYEKFSEICRNLVPVTDNEAKFILRTPNGSAFPHWVRHDFPGHSQFNTLHSLMRFLREKADVSRGTQILGVEGHKHNWAIHEEEVQHKGYFFTCARARGYKVADDYAVGLGYDNQEFGASIVYIMNPQAKSLAQATSIWKDVESGAEYLTWLRAKYQ
jgi:hypothetical protein